MMILDETEIKLRISNDAHSHPTSMASRLWRGTAFGTSPPPTPSAATTAALQRGNHLFIPLMNRVPFPTAVLRRGRLKNVLLGCGQFV